MKQSILFFIALLFILLISCESKKDESEITTGLVGSILYGIGDCMPVIDETSREYLEYNGDVFFIAKSDVDYPLNGRIEEIRDRSIKRTIVNGILSVELPVDTFYVMPQNIYLFSDYNLVIIQKDEVLVKKFKFWECTSY